MQANSKKNRAVIASVLCLAAVSGLLKAQPDLGAAGKGDNPPNRDAAQRAALKAAKDERRAGGQKMLDKLAERDVARQEQRIERVPRYLQTFGIGDEAIQQAIIAHLKKMSSARQEVTKAQLQLRRFLVLKNTVEPQLKEAMSVLRKAESDYDSAFQKSLTELDGKIFYSKSPRLEAALLSLGALDPKGIIGAA